MTDTLLPLILVLFAFYLWQAGLKAREQARELGRALCAQAQVQLLDQTVSLQRVRVARGDDGWLHLRRRYRFELSTNGADRHLGSLDMFEGRLLSWSLPAAANAAATTDALEPDLAKVIAFPETRH